MGQNAANLLFCWKMAKIYWGLILVTLNPLLLLLLMFVFFSLPLPVLLLIN